MGNLIIVAMGTTALDVVESLLQNQILFMNDLQPNVRIATFESDSSGTSRFCPSSPFRQSLHTLNPTILYLPGPELVGRFARGQMKHLDSVPHNLLTFEDERFGFALYPPLGHVATAVNYDEVLNIIKKHIEAAAHIQEGKASPLTIVRVLNASGGTGNGMWGLTTEMLLNLANQLEGGVELQIIDIVLVPTLSLNEELGPKQKANAAGLLRLVAAYKAGWCRPSHLTTSGYGELTTQNIKHGTYFVSNVGKGTASPQEIVPTLSNFITTISITPSRPVWHKAYTDAVANVPPSEIPTVARLGTSTVFLPRREEEAYETYCLMEHISSRGLHEGEGCQEVASRLLANYNLVENQKTTHISTALAKVSGTDVYRVLHSPLQNLAPRSRKPSRRVVELKAEFDRAEKIVLGRLEPMVQETLQEFIARVPSTIRSMVEDLIFRYPPGRAFRVLQHVRELLAESVEEVSKVGANMTALLKETRAKAFHQREAWIKVASQSPLYRLGRGGQIRQMEQAYKRYRFDAIHRRISLELRKSSEAVLKEASRHVDEALDVLNKAVTLLNEICQRSRIQAEQFVTDTYPYRGLGIPLRTGKSFEARFRQRMLEEKAWKEIGGPFSEKINQVAFQSEGAGHPDELFSHLRNDCRAFIHKQPRDQKENDITHQLQQHPEKERIVRKALEMAAELLPADQVEGRGKHINLVALPGGPSSPLCPQFETAAAELGVQGGLLFGESGQPDLIIVIRSEIGRRMDTVKLFRDCEKQLAKMGSERYGCFADPLFELLPVYTEDVSPEEACKLFIRATLVDAVQKDGDGFVYRNAAGQDLPIGALTEESLVEFWSRNFRARVDAASRYIQKIRETGFGPMLQSLDVRQGKLPPGWDVLITRLAQEIKELARRYHQNV